MSNIVDYVFETFPTNDNTFLDFKQYCLQFTDVDKWNWKIFTQNLSDFLFNQDNTITISNSSTWAICQEFLGNLSGRDLSYSQSRGGLWSLRIDKNLENKENPDNTTNNVEVISVRRILNVVKKEYP
jgi:hypothetical protein